MVRRKDGLLRSDAKGKLYKCSMCGKERFYQPARAKRDVGYLCRECWRKYDRNAGERNPAWKGEMAQSGAAHSRSQRTYPKIQNCVTCGEPAIRHHKDVNPLNNEPSNIQWLCNKCHIRLHLGKGKEMECVGCGKKQWVGPSRLPSDGNYVCRSCWQRGLGIHKNQFTRRR